MFQFLLVGLRRVAVRNQVKKVKMSRVALIRTFNAMCKDLRQNSVRWMTHEFVVSSDAYLMSKFNMTSPLSGDLINEHPLNLCLIDC